MPIPTKQDFNSEQKPKQQKLFSEIDTNTNISSNGIENSNTSKMKHKNKSTGTLHKNIRTNLKEPLDILSPSRRKQRSIVTETIKKSLNAQKEKQTYEQRVNIMKNKIAALKKQEDFLKRKMEQQALKEKEMLFKVQRQNVKRN